MQGGGNSLPDGGYGWVVVVSAFIVMGLTTAVLKTFGLFFVEIQQHFDELASTTSWITSITIAMFHLGAPLASSLCARYTHRAVVIIGGLLAFSGMTLGSFGFNTVWMYTTTGFLQGLGISFSWTSAISIVSHYFSNRRALANAVASAGECAFAFTFGPFFQWLIGLYGWKSALLIIGGIQLNICVCGALMRPLKDRCVLEARSSEAQRPSGKVVPMTGKEHASPITQKTFNWMLVKRLEFILYAIFGILAAMSFFIPPLFLVPLSYSLRIDESWTASLLSILAIADFMGRLLCGCTTVSIHITVLADVVGMSDFDSALGLFMLIRSTGGFLGPPLAGLIVDMAENYSAGFYIAGVTLVISTVFLVVIDQLQQKKEQETQTDTKPKKQILLFPSLYFLKFKTGKCQEQNMGV
ncbi:monocarboxylate transporter 7-like [Terrapene carolina triunguis]|uniref:monocarboxylate transporter 7-like n=1 Tax=Terrapene triunguis TaxID=2587831 RepID=UPI001156C0B1|nr:monocarboxylate transporter 7-like [Terrapene carolina triunguis]